MIFLYSQAQARQAGRRARTSLFFSCALVAAALIACAALCARVTTGNAQWMLYKVICLFTLAGWIAIAVLRLVYRPSAAACRHMTSILEGEEEEMEGVITLSSAAFQIPKSVLARRVSLAVEGEEEARKLNVDARHAKKLPPDGALVRVRVVRKFITAIEVLP